MSGPTLVYRLYVAFSDLMAPIAFRRVRSKLKVHGTPDNRIAERQGHASANRPSGRLIWFHAASVGESLSVLSVITRLGELHTDLSFLVTSGTATSAKLISQRMPPRCQHQFAPLDSRTAMARFLNHWHPDGAVFVESELWPQMLVRTRARQIPMVLLNARLSDASVRKWNLVGRTARFILGVFDGIRTQNQRTADHLISLGAKSTRVRVGQNIKSTSAALPVDEAALSDVRAMVGSRPLWVASSTHAGEEDIVLEAHKLLLRDRADACLILVPRHPERAGEVSERIANAGLSMAQRSAQERLSDETQVYLADTLGETGLWYAASPLVFLGGSLLEIGGHNPFEVAQAGAAVLTGPYVANFAETFETMAATGASQTVDSAGSLGQAITTLLDTPPALDAAKAASAGFAQSQIDQLDDVAADLSQLLHLS